MKIEIWIDRLFGLVMLSFLGFCMLCEKSGTKKKKKGKKKMNLQILVFPFLRLGGPKCCLDEIDAYLFGYG